MSASTCFRRLAIACLVLLPALAQAHPGHTHDTGLVAGALHPFTGLDHLCGLVIAGLLLGWIRGPARGLAFAGFLGLLGLAHALWLAPDSAGAGFVFGLMLMSAGLIAAGLVATRMLARFLTAAAH